MSWRNCFTKLDLYSFPINFTYEHKKYFSTNCGGCTSLFIFLVLIIYLIYTLYSLFTNGLPYIFLKKIMYENPISIKIMKDEMNSNNSASQLQMTKFNSFYFSIGINQISEDNLHFKPLDDRYLNLKIHQIKFKNGEIEMIPLEFEMCTKFGNYDQSFFDLIQLNKTYCINQNIEFNGQAGKEDSSWLEIKLAKCLDNQNCKSKEEIKKYLENVSIEFFHENKLINVTSSAGNAIINDIEMIQLGLINDFTTVADFKLALNELHFYENFLPTFLSKNHDIHYSYNLKNDIIEYIDIDEKEIILEIKIFSNREVNVITKVSPDLFSLFGLLGGCSIILFQLGTVVVCAFRKHNLSLNLINKFFNIVSPEKDEMIKIKFENFIEKHYNKLAYEYFRNNFSLTLQTDNLFVGNTNKFYKFNSDKQSVEKIIKETFEIEDDEGVFNHLNNNLNPIEIYFTMKRIESMFSVTKNLRNSYFEYLINNEKVDSNFNFYQSFLLKKKKNTLYEIEKTVYDLLILTCFDQIRLPISKLLKRLIYRCCMRREKEGTIAKYLKKDFNNIIKKKELNANEDSLSIFKLFDAGKMMFQSSFSFTTVLKSVENFDKFKKIFMSGIRNRVFDSVSKINIKVAENEEVTSKIIKIETEKDLKNLKSFHHSLMQILNNGHVLIAEKNMLLNMGMPLYEMRKFSNAIEESKMKDEFSKEKMEYLKNLDEINEILHPEKDGINNDDLLTDNQSPEFFKKINKMFN